MASAVYPSAQQAPSPSSLIRTESASSSNTIQPNISNMNGSLDSSVTSAPTTSTSVHHERKPSSPKKKIAVTSTHRIEDPLRSPPFFEHQHTRSQDSSTHSQQGRTRQPTSPTGSSRASQSSDRFTSPLGTPRLAERRKWAERYATLGDYGNESFVDENVPMSKASPSEDDVEEKRIQQNLENWAAREKQKRREHRSRASVGNGAAPATSKLAKRLSMLGTGGTSSKVSSPNRHSVGPGSHLYESTARQSMGSMDSYVSSSRTRVDESFSRKSSVGTPGLETAQEDEDGSLADETLTNDRTSAKAKGKARDVSNPFKDPQMMANGSAWGPPSHTRVKPRPGIPIVTPGRAPTIRHRVIEHAEATGLYSQAPSIVATDVEEEQAQHARRDVSNPFRTPGGQEGGPRTKDGEQDITHGGMGQARRGSRIYPLGTTIVEGARATPDEKAQNRKSTSSRFNEVGLDDEEDADGWPEDGEQTRTEDSEPTAASKYEYGQGWRTADGHPGRMQRLPEGSTMRANAQTAPLGAGEPQPPHERRRPWWSEWLCGIGPPRDDEEQSGRTFPE